MPQNIRNNTNIRGITIQNEHIKITQLADDTTLILKDRESLVKSLEILKHLQSCAGLQLNRTKTEMMPLGACNNISANNTGLKCVTETKTLGIILSKDIKAMTEINFKEKYKKIATLLNMWKTRNLTILTIKGKITLLKSKALPMLLYTANMIYVPDNIIKQFEKLFYDFIWPKGKHHVPKNLIIQPTCDGGLNMPDVEAMIKSLKVSWITRLIQNRTKIQQLCTNCNKH